MSIESEQILRDDFPTARRGWDPEAVRAHLRKVADLAAASASEVAKAASKTPLAEAAVERVGTIIEAAERKAAEIEADALAEAERIINSASEQTSERVSIAQQAIEGLVSQADELHKRVGSLGEQVVGQFRILSRGKEDEMSAEMAIAEDEIEIHSETTAEITPPFPDPGPPVPPSIPEPTPDPIPEPTPDPTPEPSPDPSPDPMPEIDPPQPPIEPDPIPEPTIEADPAAARLVAMNLALGGASREEISVQLESDFGQVEGVNVMLDDVLARVG